MLPLYIRSTAPGRRCTELPVRNHHKDMAFYMNIFPPSADNTSELSRTAKPKEAFYESNRHSKKNRRPRQGCHTQGDYVLHCGVLRRGLENLHKQNRRLKPPVYSYSEATDGAFSLLPLILVSTYYTILILSSLRYGISRKILYIRQQNLIIDPAVLLYVVLDIQTIIPSLLIALTVC